MLLNSLRELSPSLLSRSDAWVFSLGKFDGFHMGHQRLIQEMKKMGNKIALLSFSNNPSAVLHPNSKPKMIQTLEHRIECARRAKIDAFILEPFTLQMAGLEYDEFLEGILAKIPFKHLVLGDGARFGKDRGGSPDAVREWCATKDIEAHYISKALFHGEIAGSRSVRDAIANATSTQELKKVTSLLERPYSLLARFQRYNDRYALSRHHLEEIALPQIRKAPVRVVFEGTAFSAMLSYEAPFDLHLENLNLKVPAGIFEVTWA